MSERVSRDGQDVVGFGDGGWRVRDAVAVVGGRVDV